MVSSGFILGFKIVSGGSVGRNVRNVSHLFHIGELALVPGASHYATSSSFYANATPQSPMFASGNGGAIDEDVLRYQPLLKQNYHILELAGYTPSTNQQNIATSVSSPLTGRAPTFLFDSRPGLPMTTSLQNLPASTYQPVVVDNEPVMVKKVIKKLLILSLAQEAWLRRNTKAVRNGSPKRHDIAAADQSSWLSMIFPSGAESQEQAVAELAKRIGAQREIITLCIQLVEMVFEVSCCECACAGLIVLALIPMIHN